MTKIAIVEVEFCRECPFFDADTITCEKRKKGEKSFGSMGKWPQERGAPPSWCPLPDKEVLKDE